MKKYDRTYALVDLDAIRHNIKEAKDAVSTGTKIMAIVKADAYGHGAVPVAEALSDLVDAYGVATIEEAIELREAGIQHMILILGYTGEDWFEEVVRYRISQTIYTLDMAEKLGQVAHSMGKVTPIHIKIDTGMGRIGFEPTYESADIVSRIADLPGLYIEGLFTHFARADEETNDAIVEPFKKYMDFVNMLTKRGITIPIKHVSNSAAILSYPDANLDMVRSGITTYGLYPSKQVSRKRMCLKPAMQWKAKISFVKDIQPGMSIGYGGTFTASHSMKVATVAVGYADGMKRALSGCGRVLVHGRYAPILGRICMDQFMIDVSFISDVSEGDLVTIFGMDGSLEIPVEEIADLAGSFNYEFVCSVTHRVPRKYINQ